MRMGSVVQGYWTPSPCKYATAYTAAMKEVLIKKVRFIFL